MLITYAIYLVGANWFINSSTLAKLIDSWDDGIAHYKWGASPFPGVIWIRGLSFWHQDKNVLWNTQAPNAFVVAWLPSLLSKKLHFSWIRLSEANFHFIQKKKLKDTAKVKEGFYASLEFPRPPRPKKPPGKTEDKWGIVMKRVTIASLTDAWFDEYRYRGSIKVHGGFSIDPDREVTVGPAYVEFSPGKFFLGNREMGEDLKGRIDYVMPGFHPDAPDPVIYHSMTIDVNLTLKTKTIAPANVYLTSVDWLRFGDGQGPVKIRIKLDKGVLTDPTHIEYETQELQFTMGKFLAKAGAKVKWLIKDGQANLDADLKGLRVFAPQDPAPMVDDGNLGITASTKDLDVADNLFNKLDLGLKLANARVPQLVSFNRFFPKGSPFKFHSGSAELNTKMEASGEREVGVLDFETKDAKLSYVKQYVKAKVTLKVPFANESKEKGRFKITDASLRLSNLVFLSDQPSDRENWWGEFEFPKATVVSSPEINVKGAFKLKMADTAPVIKILRPDTTGADIVTRMLTSNDVASTGEFAVNETGFSIDRLVLNSDSLKLRGFYREQNSRKDARILAAQGPFAVGVELKGDTSRIILQDAYGWYAKGAVGE